MLTKFPFLKVLLVDEDPHIRRLTSLIDWEEEGYIISEEASNGNLALQLLKDNEYDLIISDIKALESCGEDLVTTIKSNNSGKVKVIFISEFNDFYYVKNAIKCGCYDYILKPINKNELLTTLRRIANEYQKEVICENTDYERAYLERHLIAVIWGEYDDVNLHYVQEKIEITDELAYIHCEISLKDERFLALSKEERREQQRKLYNHLSFLLQSYKNHVIYDYLKYITCYNVGIIFCSSMARENGLSLEEWLQWLIKELTERMGYEIVACRGCKVNEIDMISKSYREAIMLRSFILYERYQNDSEQLLCDKKADLISFSEEEIRIIIDELLHAIEINDKPLIRKNTKALYRIIMDKSNDTNVIIRYTQYLLHRMMGLAYEKDVDFNQELIKKYTYDIVFSSKSNHGNELKFQQCAEYFSDFLTRFRKDTSKGSIDMIEEDINENYAENISLKSLGEKYHFNSAYLGQLFKKRYGCCFKDYLNKVRIRKAAEMMISSDKRVYEIAVDVGYKNQEYFINKFEEIYGVTPGKFRKIKLGE